MLFSSILKLAILSLSFLETVSVNASFCPTEYMEPQLPCTDALETQLGRSIQDIFSKHGADVTKPFFQSAGSREFVECDTIMRISHQVFCQEERSACGLASVAQVAVSKKPEQLAEVIAEVYFKGTIQSIGYQMSPYLSELNFDMPDDSDAEDNMRLGSFLVFASALRDARNQKLTSMDPSTVPTDGYERIRATPYYQPEGSSFISTAYDVQYFYEMFGYETQMFIGSDGELCAACENTQSGLFPSDFAALKDIMNAKIKNQAVPSFPWSIRSNQALASPEMFDQMISETMSRVGKDGFEFACKNPLYSSIEINNGMSSTPVDTSTCNGEICLPEHWVQLNSCDLTNDVCAITSYGKLETHSCATLRNFTTAVVTAFDQKNEKDKNKKKKNNKNNKNNKNKEKEKEKKKKEKGQHRRQE